MSDYESADEMFAAIEREHDEAPWFRKAWWALLRAKDRFQPIEGTKWKIQRARRGFSEQDVWSFENYLAVVIAGGCRRLIATSHGHPMSLESEGVSNEEAAAKWSLILSEIAAGFESYTANEDAQDPAFKRAMELFAQYYPNLWD